VLLSETRICHAARSGVARNRFREKRESLERFKDLYTKAKARIWPRLSCVPSLLDSGWAFTFTSFACIHCDSSTGVPRS
jgi:hypothetical protein